jgi:hypothetical protein
MAETKILKLKGLAMYARVQPGNYDTKFNPTWTVDLLLDKESLKIAKAEKLRIKKTSVDKSSGDAKTKYAGLFEGYDGTYIRVTRPVQDRDGKDREPPALKDGKLRDIPSSVGIGNGSLVNVQFIVKNGDAETLKNYGGYGTFLLGMQVLKLVPFERSGDPDTDFVEEDDAEYETKEAGGFEFEKADTIDDAFDSSQPAAK